MTLGNDFQQPEEILGQQCSGSQPSLDAQQTHHSRNHTAMQAHARHRCSETRSREHNVSSGNRITILERCVFLILVQSESTWYHGYKCCGSSAILSLAITILSSLYHSWKQLPAMTYGNLFTAPSNHPCTTHGNNSRQPSLRLSATPH